MSRKFSHNAPTRREKLFDARGGEKKKEKNSVDVNSNKLENSSIKLKMHPRVLH